ncbi:BQ5605_C001g00371 [Microbotryum silenes-dioicae]|uniref:BQ5605_C001g00371 protein n=1 Tax=Microbotryum silenes-dioicae TaxID=796604 RepID=A0A2X0P005_9BASI|nr:BQ5605_C001g00371 [Microbotryum silenes-dioicae]
MPLVDCRNDTDTAGAPHHVTNASPRLARQAELCCRSNIMQSHALAAGAADTTVCCERHEIALEPHWFRVQTERIKRCNSQAKKDYSKD